MTEKNNVNAVTASELEALIQQGHILFVDFWAKWCAPCRQFAPIYERVASHYEKIMFVSIDIEQESQLAEEFQIRSIPHLMVFKSGIAIYSDSGSMPESVLRELVEQAILADVSDIHQELKEDEEDK